MNSQVSCAASCHGLWPEEVAGPCCVAVPAGRAALGTGFDHEHLLIRFCHKTSLNGLSVPQRLLAKSTSK